MMKLIRAIAFLVGVLVGLVAIILSVLLTIITTTVKTIVFMVRLPGRITMFMRRLAFWKAD